MGRGHRPSQEPVLNPKLDYKKYYKLRTVKQIVSYSRMDPESKAEKTKKPRTEAQKAATAKALASLKARREIAREVIGEDMHKQVEEAEERIVAKVMSRMGVVKESEEDAPEVKKAVKKAVAVVVPEKKKKVVVVEESESDSSSEEEVVVRKVKKVKDPEPVKQAIQKVNEVKPRTTGNKLLDKMYGFI